MANKARGEIKLDLGGETYVLVPSFAAVCEIEDKLGSDLFHIGMRAEDLKFNAKELVHTIQTILEANGYDVDERAVAEAIAKEGASSAVVALITFVRVYVWGRRPETNENSELQESVVSTEANSATT